MYEFKKNDLIMRIMLMRNKFSKQKMTTIDI